MNFKKRGITPFLTVSLLLGIFVVAGWLLEQHSMQWDATLAKEYTLSPETLKLLKQKMGDVEIMAFFQPEQAGRDRAAYLLDTYANASNKIHYRFVDPDREPALAEKYNVKGYGQLVIRYEGHQERVTFITEQDITNALAKLVMSESKVVYFVTGHGERELGDFGGEGYSRLKHALGQQNYRVVTLNLMTTRAVPADAALVVVAGPRKELFPEEIERLNKYVEEGGGGLLIFSDPYYKTNLEAFLASKNILLQVDLIIDKQSHVLGGDYLMPVISKYAKHEITEKTTTVSIFHEARSVRAKKGENWIARELAWTSEESWAETDLKSAREGKMAIFNEGKDIKGPVSVMVISTKIFSELKTPGGGLGADLQTLRLGTIQGKAFNESHVVVIGDSDFAKNTLFDMGGNSELALNAINFVAKSPQLISIRPRSRETSPLTLTYAQAKWLFWYSFAFIPGVILIGGFIAWSWKRGHR